VNVSLSNKPCMHRMWLPIKTSLIESTAGVREGWRGRILNLVWLGHLGPDFSISLIRTVATTPFFLSLWRMDSSGTSINLPC
jgi:hypothetical protein